MKTINLLFLAIVLLVVACNSSNKNETENSDKKIAESKNDDKTEVKKGNDEISVKHIYKVESGYIKFKTNTAGIDMTRELWFDDFGNKQYEENYMLIMDEKHGSKSLILDGFSYSWDLDAEQGTKMKFYAAVTDYDNVSEKDIEKYGIKKHGHEDVLGKECLKVSTEEPVKSNIWMWNNIPLKTEAEFGGEPVLMEAVEINIGKVDAAKFTLPDNIEFVDYP
ncbi:MAG TPA: hypothetical protein PLO05_07850 [Bacteroidales bacterium]|nr:hypothetical protein [Bacteroidales bacterium]HXK82053.1 hypothetical protein [Bacteroidales bacterium]